MKILILNNLYPPHHAGSFDLRCQGVTEALRKRGHVLRVLTSNHGVGDEQRDPEIERRLVLNGVFDHPLITGYGGLRELEERNHSVLRQTLAEFQPDLVHVWSLHGLSKSLIFSLRESRLPTVYDVADNWLSEGLREDPWLRWWNRTDPSALDGVRRRTLELSGMRTRVDALAPTRMMQGYDRMPDVYAPAEALASVQPNSVAAFRFQHLYFCSHALKAASERAGFQVQHAEVIHPGIRAELFAGVVKPQSAPVKKLLIVTRLTPPSGVMTALEAMKLGRQNKLKVTLSLYGRGESEYVAQLRSYVINHQLPVEFLNVSNLNKDLVAVYRDHDVFLHTAEWDEPFSSAPLEAMAAGLPVIAAKTGGMRELIRHGENGFAYTPKEPAELVSRIHEVLIGPALRCQVAETAQMEVMSYYNETSVVDRIEGVLQTACQTWQHE